MKEVPGYAQSPTEKAGLEGPEEEDFQSLKELVLLPPSEK